MYRDDTLPILQTENITCGYHAEAVLEDLSLALEAGEFLGVIGPNGCGKSTLIRALTGILPPRRGSVRLDGRDLPSYSRKEIARQIAVIPQDTTMLFGFTVLEMVLMGRNPHLRRLQRAGSKDVDLAMEALAQTDMSSLKDRRVTELSGGERQRAVVARALAQQPRILLLDEPDSHLDIGHQIEIFDLLDTLNRSAGLTLLCVSHDLNLASTYSHRIVLMDRGKVVAEGSPPDIVTPDNIRSVYGIEAVVQANPVSGAPQITPKTGSSVRLGKKLGAD